MTIAASQLPNNYLVPAGNEGVQLPAGGGSIINFSNVTVYVCPTQESIGNTEAAAPLVPGTSLPWPANITCYGFVAGNTSGSVYITPITSTAYPVPQLVYIGVGPQAVNFSAQNASLYYGVPSTTENSNQLIADVGGNGIVISSATLSSPAGVEGGWVQLEANGILLASLTDDNLSDHFDGGQRGLYVPPGSQVGVNNSLAGAAAWTSYVWAHIIYDQL